MNTYDVIIIGGSVSGSPTAMLLAQQGIKVLLIDKQTFPRDVNSTHFIWPRGVSYLRRWGLGNKFRDTVPHCRDMELNIEGIGMIGSVPLQDLQNRFSSLHGDAENITDLYMGPRRYFLDTILMEAAKEAGVEVREGATFDHITQQNGTVTGIVGKNADGSRFSAQASLVIGADGRYSSFAEQVGARITDKRNPSTFAYYGYFSGISQSMLAIHKKGRLGTAIFPTQDDTHLVLVYGPHLWWDEFRKDAEQNFLFTYEYCSPAIAEKIAQSKRTEAFKSCGWMPAFKRENTGPGWALIGDAASFKDQVSAMGITHAFRDAELITQHITHAFSKGFDVSEALLEYATARSNDYNDYFNLVCNVAEMNPYKKEEIKHIYRTRNNQSVVNTMISQFGDTLPVHFTAANDTNETSCHYPDWIRNYDIDHRRYHRNIYLSAQANSIANEGIVLPV